eukprot:CAMPEP_0184191118 /NCGR_PEP_ID=MMETSP0976-20121227/2818_1 /TAXON_ID=483370 /ORGANISM="non described non described, Strain CCMP2097" /LENGTH=176 /DNA_ID=CAMNT_0026495519 /DNA_START=46 /DNA_END=575 /DNA_ORIENTATION=-
MSCRRPCGPRARARVASASAGSAASVPTAVPPPADVFVFPADVYAAPVPKVRAADGRPAVVDRGASALAMVRPPRRRLCSFCADDCLAFGLTIRAARARHPHNVLPTPDGPRARARVASASADSVASMPTAVPPPRRRFCVSSRRFRGPRLETPGLRADVGGFLASLPSIVRPPVW